VARFLRSFQILLKSARLYDRDHPQVQQSLAAVEAALRAAQSSSATRSVGVRVTESGFRNSGSERAIPDARGDLRGLAQELSRAGIRALFLPAETHLGELAGFAALLARKPAQVRAKKPGAADSQELAMLPVDEEFSGNWTELLQGYRIEAIGVNVRLEEPKADAAIASLVAVVLSEAAGTAQGEARAETPEELLATLTLLARVGGALTAQATAPPQQMLQTLRDLVGAAELRPVRILERTMAREALNVDDPLEAYVERLTGALVLEFVVSQFENRKVTASELRPLLLRLAGQIAAVSSAPAATGMPAALALFHAPWTDETWAEHLQERFWTELHASEKHGVLHGADAWCVPTGALVRYLEPAIGGSEASMREARAAVLDYSRCLLAKGMPARQATATGLSELGGWIARLWPEKLPPELVERAVWALADEKSPEVAGLLSAVTATLAQLAYERGHFETLDMILDVLEKSPRDDAHAHLKMLAGRLLRDERWNTLVNITLEHRHLDPWLARIVGRDPDRLIDSLSVPLTDGRLDTIPAMARLIRAIGEPVIGALVNHLYDPRSQQASTAVKLLAATQPERLLAALPRALPGWDWNLQDLAVSELVSISGDGSAGLQASARAFLGAVPHAHPLVVPMMLDQIGLAKDKAAVPMLMLIAAGIEERLKDVFVRIKAVEALGRIGAASGTEAAELLRQILRERRGLTHMEPAGLRAAAEEALGLIENWPSSARVRTAREALEKSSVTHARPRRYLRIPLDAPLHAKICGPPEVTARVRTISLGGAFLESSRRLNVGEAVEVEIKSGLRSIHSKAVVRNLAPGGGGVEFVHMKQDDREKLRKLVSKLLRE
jgi:hypothetical protein